MTTAVPIKRKWRHLDYVVARFKLMMKTDRAMIEAKRVLARTLPDTAEAIVFARRAYAQQRCLDATRIETFTPVDDQHWAIMRLAARCRQFDCVRCSRAEARTYGRRHLAMFEAIRAAHPGMRAVLITLTSRNRPITEASEMVSDHIRAFKAFTRRREVKRAYYGLLTGVECPVRGTADAPEIGTHSHTVALVDDRSFAPDRYLTVHRISALFQEALGVDYKPLCWVSAVGGRPRPADDPDGDDDLDNVMDLSHGALAEAVKYPIKVSSLLQKRERELLFPQPHDTPFVIDPHVVLHLTRALSRRKLVTLSGLWHTYRQQMMEA